MRLRARHAGIGLLVTVFLLALVRSGMQNQLPADDSKAAASSQPPLPLASSSLPLAPSPPAAAPSPPSATAAAAAATAADVSSLAVSSLPDLIVERRQQQLPEYADCVDDPVARTRKCLEAPARAGAGLDDPPRWQQPCRKCYVITLMRNQARQRHVEANLTRAIPGLQIVPAVDSHILSTAKVQQAVDNGWLKNAPYLVADFQFTRSAVSMSHLSLWLALARSPDPQDWALILEDDAMVDAGSFSGQMALLMDELRPFSWDMVLLFKHPLQAKVWDMESHVALPGTSGLAIMRYGAYGHVGYLVSRRGARRLSHCLTPLNRWQDLVMARAMSSSLCVVRPSQPMVFTVGEMAGVANHSFSLRSNLGQV